MFEKKKNLTRLSGNGRHQIWEGRTLARHWGPAVGVQGAAGKSRFSESKKMLHLYPIGSLVTAGLDLGRVDVCFAN